MGLGLAGPMWAGLYLRHRTPRMRAGMFAGSLFVGVHMALTHGVTLGMVASYIPATSVPGIGRITGTCWSFTDFIFGVRAYYIPFCSSCPLAHHAAAIQLLQPISFIIHAHLR